MTILPLDNPFGAPVYHLIECQSTMDEARRLAAPGPDAAPNGTVVAADSQSAGRGRTRGRVWSSEAGDGLLFTLILRYGSFAELPAALTLRIGVAVALALEDRYPTLGGRVEVKWPNDVMIDRRKACGILCEGDGRTVYAGIGVNLGQRRFGGEVAGKAISLRMALGEGFAPAGPSPDGLGPASEKSEPRWILLERILHRIDGVLADAMDWRAELDARLYKKGEAVDFHAGAADSGRSVAGVLVGVAPQGELLIREAGSGRVEGFHTGELPYG